MPKIAAEAPFWNLKDKAAVRWRAHQKRWQQLHQWEETLPPPSAQPDPGERLRWCEEALALSHRYPPTVPLPLDDEQIRHWRLTRRSLPHRLPARHGQA
jgi:hypothetical protein